MVDRQDDFYVGYLPVGARQKVLLRFVVPGLLWLTVAIAALMAMNQRDPGPGYWASESESFAGTIVVDPYPVLHLPSGESLLLVEQGKIGVDRTEPPNGTPAIARGLIIERRGLRMLEIEPGETGLRAAGNGSPLPLPTIVELGETELRGEIVDSKCFLGVMKPGEGKTHRTCATLCIRGGIPPALASKSPDGLLEFHLLIGADGRSIGAEVLDFVAERVRVRGRAEQRGVLRYLRIEPSDIERL